VSNGISNGKSKRCKRSKCRKSFDPATPWQKFCTIACGNLERQRRRREEFKALKKAANGK
jgi:hypothetical protein